MARKKNGGAGDLEGLERLRVVGNHSVDGHEPGDEFDRVIGPHEQMLIDAGHIARVSDIHERQLDDLEPQIDHLEHDQADDEQEPDAGE